MEGRKPTAYQTGVAGEALAEAFLVQKGMRLLYRRYRCSYGEADLVMMDGDMLVFVEVKARPNGDDELAQVAVNRKKQTRLTRTALYFLSDHPEKQDCIVRFDVVTVTKAGIHHLPNAFEAAEI